MDRDFRIEIKDNETALKEFSEIWKKAERGDLPDRPVERLYFQDLATLLKVLSPRRLEALTVLHKTGPQSVRALAKRLRRDYKNVHRDIQLLERIGLVARDREGLATVPWERIVAEIRLAA